MGDKLRVGINGFGRIGRAIFRINEKYKHFDVVAINEINPDTSNIAYTLRHDTTYGKASFEVVGNERGLAVDGKQIDVYHKQSIADVPWAKHGVDIVIEASGIHKNIQEMRKCKGEVKNFVVTHSANGMDQYIIMGCNDDKLDPTNNFIISSSICDAVAMAPILKQLEETHDIEGGFLTTLHPWLSYQNLLDGPSKSEAVPGDIFSNYSLGRASPMAIIPKSTSAVKATEMAMPHLKTKIKSFSFRIPTPIVSCGVLKIVLNKPITADEIKKIFSDYEKKQTHKIIKNSTDPLISVDFTGDEYSAVIDHRWTETTNDHIARLIYWYDNEWGYSSRVVDLVNRIGEIHNGNK